jgi:signal transduction histidine kinase
LRDYIESIEALVLQKNEVNIEVLKAQMKTCQKQQQVDLIKEDIDELISDVRAGLERVRKIVQGLRNFSRVDQFTERSEYDINDGVTTTLFVVNNELKYDAEVKCVFQSDVPTVMANGGQINQVILNLLLNAVQSIRDHKGASGMGLIIIETAVESGYAVVRVTDNGPGMSTETLNRLFEPFYTTKPPGLGTGLGLSICYDILVNKHQGFLRASNHVNQGAIFEIGLPLNMPIKED